MGSVFCRQLRGLISFRLFTVGTRGFLTVDSFANAQSKPRLATEAANAANDCYAVIFKFLNLSKIQPIGGL